MLSGLLGRHLLVGSVALGLAVLGALGPAAGEAQAQGGKVRIYVGAYGQSLPQVQYTIERLGSGYRVYRGYSVGPLANVALTVSGNRVFLGYQVRADRIAYTLEGNRIIPGPSARPGLAAFTVSGNRVFNGSAARAGAIAYTYVGHGNTVWMFEGSATAPLANAHRRAVGDIDGMTLLLMPILATGRY
jgi:hypothetical protein